MATITPAVTVDGRRKTILWEACATGDTILAYEMDNLDGPMGAVQFAGTFNGGTSVGLTASNDGTNYVALTDIHGTSISGLTAAALHDFSTAAKSIKPSIASGSGDDVDVTVVLRGY